MPLLAAYEWASEAATLRNTSELVLTRALAPLGGYEDMARVAILAVLGIVALVRLRLAGEVLGRTVLRTALEGVVAAILLGPVLVLLVGLVGDSVGEIALPPARPIESADVGTLHRAALVFGASAWEEFFFRVGVYSLSYLVVLRVARFLGAPAQLSRGAAELIGLVGSSFFFAAAHLEGFVGLFGAGGEPFHSGLFAWRAFAGVCLGVLFRWRGVGVAAWTHGVFNVALLLGAGPAVFL